jgi:hypothetical protein
MDKLKTLRDKHGLAVMHVAQYGAEVNTGWTAVALHQKRLSEIPATTGVAGGYIRRDRDFSSSDLVLCISDRD